MEAICMTFGYSRQAYYKHKQLEEFRTKRDQNVLAEVRNIRHKQPKVGVRKLHIMLNNLEQSELKISRDQLFELLARNDMLVKQKQKFIHTSRPDKKASVFPNLMDKKTIDKKNQAWVVDITYLNTCYGFAYLYLITDRYSRKIISFVVANRLHAKYACKVLQKAISTVDDPAGIIHHSDHGSQYCSEEYQNILNSNKILCSMTGIAHCYDNAVAERINGILKQEFGLGRTLQSVKVAQELASDAIYIYNNNRLHSALMYKTPCEVHDSL